MGADMTLDILWTKDGKIDKEYAEVKLKELILAETDVDVLNQAHLYLFGKEIDPLTLAVIKQVEGKTICDSLVNGYMKRIYELENSFNSQEVTTVRLGKDIIGYATGGLSWGDNPTEAQDDWYEFLFSGENDDDEGNPYGYAIYSMLFIDFAWKPDDTSLSPFVATISLTEKK
jgi:hypothetical protein